MPLPAGKLSRNEDVQDKLAAVDWDLVVVDEAHKMSASYFGSEIKYTKRFKFGASFPRKTRQLLLLTATPHNGKEQDFHLFLSLARWGPFRRQAARCRAHD